MTAPLTGDQASRWPEGARHPSESAGKAFSLQAACAEGAPEARAKLHITPAAPSCSCALHTHTHEATAVLITYSLISQIYKFSWCFLNLIKFGFFFFFFPSGSDTINVVCFSPLNKG